MALTSAAEAEAAATEVGRIASERLHDAPVELVRDLGAFWRFLQAGGHGGEFTFRVSVDAKGQPDWKGQLTRNGSAA